MAPQETTDVVAKLESARAELIAALRSITEEQARRRPAPDRWSVLECAEHVSFVERRFLGMVKDSPAVSAQRDAAREAALAERVTNRTNKRVAPQAVHPTGKYTSLAEALADCNAARDETVRFAAEQGADLVLRGASHPVLGPMNGVEALLLIAGRGMRHTAQNREAAEGR